MGHFTEIREAHLQDGMNMLFAPDVFHPEYTEQMQAVGYFEAMAQFIGQGGVQAFVEADVVLRSNEVRPWSLMVLDREKARGIFKEGPGDSVGDRVRIGLFQQYPEATDYIIKETITRKSAKAEFDHRSDVMSIEYAERAEEIRDTVAKELRAYRAKVVGQRVFTPVMRVIDAQRPSGQRGYYYHG